MAAGTLNPGSNSPVQQTASVAKSGLVRFLLIVAGIPALAVLLAFVILMTPTFEKYGENHWVASGTGLFTVKNQPCDVVIFGDSTGMVDLDPRVIQDKTHLVTCNVSTTVAVLNLMGLAPMDDYLARNPRPKYLLIQFAPMNMHSYPLHGREVDMGFDAYIPLLRYGNLPHAVGKMVSTPEMLIGMIYYVYNSGLVNAHMRLVSHKFTSVDPTVGSYTVIPSPALKSCPSDINRSEMPVTPATLQWIDNIRARYSNSAGKTLINATPTPECNSLAAQWTESLSGHVDNTFKPYPSHAFVDGRHLSRDGAITYSNDVADQLLALEKNQAAH